MQRHNICQAKPHLLFIWQHADCSDTEAKDPSTVNVRIASDGQVWADQTSRQLGMLSYGQDGEMVGPVCRSVASHVTTSHLLLHCVSSQHQHVAPATTLPANPFNRANQ